MFLRESGFLSFLELQNSLLVNFQRCWTQWQRFEGSSFHHFWDTSQHFLKTHVCLESGFLSYLELQNSLQVSFQGCWTQWQRFESSSIHHFLRYSTAFSENTCFCLESGFLSFLELQNSLQVSFQGCWTQWQRFESSSIHHFLDTPLHFLKICFCWESDFVLFLELQNSLQVSFQGCWTQWQRFESSSIHHFWDTPPAFSQNTCLLRKWLSFIPRAARNPY